MKSRAMSLRYLVTGVIGGVIFGITFFSETKMVEVEKVIKGPGERVEVPVKVPVEVQVESPALKARVAALEAKVGVLVTELEASRKEAAANLKGWQESYAAYQAATGSRAAPRTAPAPSREESPGTVTVAPVGASGPSYRSILRPRGIFRRR